MVEGGEELDNRGGSRGREEGVGNCIFTKLEFCFSDSFYADSIISVSNTWLNLENKLWAPLSPEPSPLSDINPLMLCAALCVIHRKQHALCYT